MSKLDLDAISYDHLDALVDVNPLELREVAWKLRCEVVRLRLATDAVLVPALDNQESEIARLTAELESRDGPLVSAYDAMSERVEILLRERAAERDVIEAAKALTAVLMTGERGPTPEMYALAAAVDALAQPAETEGTGGA